MTIVYVAGLIILSGKVNVQLLVGPPSSGKTRYAKSMLESSIENELHLDAAEFKEKLFGDTPMSELDMPESYDKLYYDMKRYLYDAVESHDFKTIYFDTMNISRDVRKALYKSLKRMNRKVNVEIVFFSSPLEHIIEHNNERGSLGFAEETIKELYLRLQVPKLGTDCDRLVVMGRPILPTHIRTSIDIQSLSQFAKEVRDIDWERDLRLGENNWHKFDKLYNSVSPEHKNLVLFLGLSKGVVDQYCPENVGELDCYSRVASHYYLNYLGETKNLIGLISMDDLKMLETIYQFHNIVSGKETDLISDAETLRVMEDIRDIIEEG